MSDLALVREILRQLQWSVATILRRFEAIHDCQLFYFLRCWSGEIRCPFDHLQTLVTTPALIDAYNRHVARNNPAYR